MWTSFTSNRRMIYSPARVLFEPKKLNHHALAEDLATSDFKRWSYLTCPALPSRVENQGKNIAKRGKGLAIKKRMRMCAGTARFRAHMKVQRKWLNMTLWEATWLTEALFRFSLCSRDRRLTNWHDSSLTARCQDYGESTVCIQGLMFERLKRSCKFYYQRGVASKNRK
jgi:hypothetical protein